MKYERISVPSALPFPGGQTELRVTGSAILSTPFSVKGHYCKVVPTAKGSNVEIKIVPSIPTVNIHVTYICPHSLSQNISENVLRIEG